MLKQFSEGLRESSARGPLKLFRPPKDVLPVNIRVMEALSSARIEGTRAELADILVPRETLKKPRIED